MPTCTCAINGSCEIVSNEALEIDVHAPSAAFPQEFLHAPHRFPATSPRPKPIAVFGKVALEDGFEYVPPRRFHGPVAHRWNAQRASLGRAGFRYPGASRRLTAVAPTVQFFAQPGQFGFGVRVKLPDALAIDSGGTRVAPDRPEGRLQIARVEHFVPEPEPFGRRLALFEPGQHAFGPHRLFHARRRPAGAPALDRLFPGAWIGRITAPLDDRVPESRC